MNHKLKPLLVVLGFLFQTAHASINVYPTMSSDTINSKIRQLPFGDSIIFTAGLYTLNSPIFLRGHMTVKGELVNGVRSSIIKKSSSYAHPLPSGSYTYTDLACYNGSTWSSCNFKKPPFLGIGDGVTGNFNNLHIKDLVINGKDDSDGDYHANLIPLTDSILGLYEPAYSLVKMGGDSSSIENCELKNSVYAGMIISGNMITIKNCKVDNTAGDGIYTIGKNITIMGNTVSRARDNGISINCADVPILDCGINSLIRRNTINNHDSLFSKNVDSSVKGYRRLSNQLHTTGDVYQDRVYNAYNIFVGGQAAPYSVKHVTIDSNNIPGCQLQCIFVKDYVDTLLIKSNTLSPPTYGLYSFQLGESTPMKYVQLFDNIFPSDGRVFIKNVVRNVVFSGNSPAYTVLNAQSGERNDANAIFQSSCIGAISGNFPITVENRAVNIICNQY